MHSTLLLLHSYVRWLVLLAGLLTVGRMASGYTREKTFGPAETRATRIFVGALDLQFLLGLVLYFVSPVTQGAMKGAADAMTDPHVRFFVAEHPLMMFLALCVAHGTSIAARKAPSNRTKFLRSAAGFAFTLGLMLAGIPWWRLTAR